MVACSQAEDIRSVAFTRQRPESGTFSDEALWSISSLKETKECQNRAPRIIRRRVPFLKWASLDRDRLPLKMSEGRLPLTVVWK
jgi:hypothetical protein